MNYMKPRFDSDHLAGKIEDLRAKPQHVRENIALLISGGITLMVFLGWLAAFTTSNPFSIKSGNTVEASAMQSPLEKAKEAGDSVNSLLGAAAASKAGATSPSTSGGKIEIVDQPAPAPDQNANATVIHF